MKKTAFILAMLNALCALWDLYNYSQTPHWSFVALFVLNMSLAIILAALFQKLKDTDQ